jgi:hypothetical protein
MPANDLAGVFVSPSPDFFRLSFAHILMTAGELVGDGGEKWTKVE